MHKTVYSPSFIIPGKQNIQVAKRIPNVTMQNYYTKMVNKTVNPLKPVGPLSPKGTKMKNPLNHTLLEEANLNATMFPLPAMSPR